MKIAFKTGNLQSKQQGLWNTATPFSYETAFQFAENRNFGLSQISPEPANDFRQISTSQKFCVILPLICGNPRHFWPTQVTQDACVSSQLSFSLISLLLYIDSATPKLGKIFLLRFVYSCKASFLQGFHAAMTAL